ncbi:MAG: DMT family transporter [Gammaproteobacteria bacterium]|nr:DMT family transporter [Gammaproteobacteria bacterium]
MSSLAAISQLGSLRSDANEARSARHRTNVLRGIAWMLLAMSCIALVDGAAKFLASEVHGMQIAWGYFLAMLINLLIVVLGRGVVPRTLLHTKLWKRQMVRASCLVGSLSCLFISLRYLPLAEATSISFTSPLFIVALAGPLLKEHIGWPKWVAVAVGMAGAMLIVRPGSDVLGWAAFLPLIGAVFFAFFSIFTRTLGAGEPIWTTLFYTTAVGTALLSPAMIFVWSDLSALQSAVLFACGTLGLIAHLSMVRAMQIADASTLAPMNYVRLVWALGIGWIMYRAVPDNLSLLGGAIIVASGLFVVSSASAPRPEPSRIQRPAPAR